LGVPDVRHTPEKQLTEKTGKKERPIPLVSTVLLRTLA